MLDYWGPTWVVLQVTRRGLEVNGHPPPEWSNRRGAYVRELAYYADRIPFEIYVDHDPDASCRDLEEVRLALHSSKACQEGHCIESKAWSDWGLWMQQDRRSAKGPPDPHSY